jgi:succinyl-diaminopimelate desuccinylase
LNIVNKAKGIVWVKIHTKGKTAHGAYPWDGENAIWNMHTFLKKLEQAYPIPSKKEWVTTVNLARIETSNQTFNKIPDECAVWLDIRCIPEDSNTIIDSIKTLLPKGFTIEIVTSEPALMTNENNTFVKKLQSIGKEVTGNDVALYGAQGSSDARHFSHINCEGIEFGPKGENTGSDNEYVDIKSLESYYTILQKFLLSLE